MHRVAFRGHAVSRRSIEPRTSLLDRMMAVAPAMPEPQRRLWNAYCTAEATGDRSRMLTSLTKFLDSACDLSRHDRYDLATSISRAADSVIHLNPAPAPFKIRVPLWKRLIFPALLDGLRHEDAQGPFLLAVHYQHVLNVEGELEQLPEAHRSDRQLLELALARDPSNITAANMLIETLARFHGMTIHEVPRGVLWDGYHGATAEQCG